MRKFSFILTLAVVLLTIAITSCAPPPLLQQEKKDVKISRQLFDSHGEFDPNRPVAYTIDSAFIRKAFTAEGEELEKLLNLSNNAQVFGIAKVVPGKDILIKGVATRPFDMFQAEFIPGTQTIKKDDNGNPMITTLFRVNGVPQLGFQQISVKKNIVIMQEPTADPVSNNDDNDAPSASMPRKGPEKSPIPTPAVEYMLKCLLTNDYDDLANNRFSNGSIFDVSWDKRAYSRMYQIIQRNDAGQIYVNYIEGNPGTTQIDSTLGAYLQFHYYDDSGQPRVAYYSYDRPDALSLIGLEPMADGGWFKINSEYSNYHGDGWNGQDSWNNVVKRWQKGDPANDVYIPKQFEDGWFSFYLPLLQKYNPDIYQAFSDGGWLKDAEDDVLSIQSKNLKKFFPALYQKLGELYPYSWWFTKFVDRPSKGSRKSTGNAKAKQGSNQTVEQSAKNTFREFMKFGKK
jgi:hypothetical protein